MCRNWLVTSARLEGCMRRQDALFRYFKKNVQVKGLTHLKTKFKWLSVTMFTLVMSIFSCDFIKTEIN